MLSKIRRSQAARNCKPHCKPLPSPVRLTIMNRRNLLSMTFLSGFAPLCPEITSRSCSHGAEQESRRLNTTRILARRYDTLRPVQITVAAGQIQSIEPDFSRQSTADNLPFVAPGLVDLQVNGLAGHELNHPGVVIEDVKAITQGMLSGGVTHYLPTCTTDSHDQLIRSLSTIAAACDDEPLCRRSIAGIHLEGPYISAEDGPRGAHPRQHVRVPSIQEFDQLQMASNDRIKLVTLSPEYAEAIPLIQHLVKRDVRVAIGHTAASSEQIKAAVDAGATLSTHLGNGAHPQIKRHPNYIWDQLADDRLTATLIADGHHLPASVLQTMLRAKGLERVLLVSDITAMAGMPPGIYPSGLGQVEVLDDGRLVVAGQRTLLAGASRDLLYCVNHLRSAMQLSLETAINLASLAPARQIGMPEHGLEVGAPANFILLAMDGETGNLRCECTLLQGEIVAGTLLA